MKRVRNLMIAVGIAVLGTDAATAALGRPEAWAQAKPAVQPAAAPVAEPTRIGFINARALLTSMTGYQKAESLWTKEATATRAEGQKLQTGFDSVVTQFQQSQAMMSPTTRSAREKQLQAQGDSLQAKLTSLQEKMAAREQELLSPMQQRLKDIIEGIRAEGGYALIIDLGNQASQNIISYDKALDITLRVAQRLASSK
ncbi:MAG: OmpH family outer membrane protein [Gemmatimonadota bacterium]